MKILYISQYFHPEVGATTNRTAAIIKEMHHRGHEVCVLSEMPNHPHGIIFPAYKGKFIVKEHFSGIPVYHLPVFASPKKSFISRILMYLSFSISALLYILIRRPKYDILYVTSPPLFSAFCVLLSKVLFPKRRIIFEVRDLWPDSATELGELTNPWLIKASLILEKSAYHKSNLIVAATNYIGKIIAKKGIQSDKIFVNRNGVDDIILDSYKSILPKQKEHLFTAIFAGNMGLAYNLEPVIYCAQLLKDEPVKFIFVGGGPCKANLENLSKRLKLHNVVFMEQIPKSEMGNLLAMADCGLICLKDLPVLSGALPVKIFDYMAFKLPIVGGIRGEAADVITEAKAGIVVPPGDSKAMADAIRKLMQEPLLVEEMGQSARHYVLQHFPRKHLASQLVSEIESRFVRL